MSHRHSSQNRMRHVFLCALFFACLTACGGGGNNNPPPPPADEALGGIWFGTDSSGLQIFVLSTDSGRIHWVALGAGEQGFGTGSVNVAAVTINYTYVASLGSTLTDGSPSATCIATGTIQERQSLSVTTNCTTSLGGSFSNSVSMTYDARYDADSSLAIVAGNYNHFGVVLNVSASGEIFEQDPATGCVVNGQVTVIAAEFNAYDVSITYSNCVGNSATLNGATFTGLWTLDNTGPATVVITALTGAVGGVTYSVTYSMPQI
jgi:hypothetical protein